MSKEPVDGVLATLILFYLTVAVLAVTIAVGWWFNLLDLLGMLGGDINALFVARIIGLFLPPIGAILGYFF